MDLLLSRFRNLTVLVIVIASQLLLLAYQVKSNQEIRLVRVWAVTAVTPMARVIESARSGTTGFFKDYFYLLDVRDENKRMKAELGRTKLENQFLKTELSTADRARALSQFQMRSPSKTLPSRIIGNGTGANSRVVYIDRGTTSGVERGMGVITPDGIIGKVIDSFPVAAQVLLVTDPTFAAGVISQKNHVRGVVQGKGAPTCTVEFVQNEEKVEVGEWFYTTGEDRVFPKGLPVGQVATVRPGKSTKEIYVNPSGFQNGFEEVLVVLEGVHQQVPEVSTASEPKLLPPPPADPQNTTQPADLPGTDADHMLEKYKKIGAAEGITYGAGYKPPNFNVKEDDPKLKKTPPAGESSPTPPAATQPSPQPGQPAQQPARRQE